LLKLDKWLSKQLGYSAYNLNAAYLKQFNFLEARSKKILITIKSNKRIDNYFLKKNKIKFIEKNLTFFKKVSPNTNTEHKEFQNIRFSKKKDKKLVLGIAQNAFMKSRFFQDTKIKKNIAKKIKRNWILNFFTKTRGDYLIVSEINKKVVGFLLMLKSQSNYIIDLIAVNRSYKNLGFASKMLNFFHNFVVKKKNSIIFVSTQAINKGSIKFYKKNKFKIKHKKYIYHFHTC
jgi:ribosomal protein S18 acetylase RimI-like enzyme